MSYDNPHREMMDMEGLKHGFLAAPPATTRPYGSGRRAEVLDNALPLGPPPVGSCGLARRITACAQGAAVGAFRVKEFDVVADRAVLEALRVQERAELVYRRDRW